MRRPRQLLQNLILNATWLNEQRSRRDKPMSAYTSGILNLHIWQVTTWAALRAGQNTFSNSSIIGAIQS